MTYSNAFMWSIRNIYERHLRHASELEAKRRWSSLLHTYDVLSFPCIVVVMQCHAIPCVHLFVCLFAYSFIVPLPIHCFFSNFFHQNTTHAHTQFTSLHTRLRISNRVYWLYKSSYQCSNDICVPTAQCERALRMHFSIRRVQLTSLLRIMVLLSNSNEFFRFSSTHFPLLSHFHLWAFDGKFARHTYIRDQKPKMMFALCDNLFSCAKIHVALWQFVIDSRHKTN